MLTETTYALLEQHVTAAFARATDRSRHGYFCDGILAPEWDSDYQPAHVARTRQIRLRAWVDEGGRRGGNATQAQYALILQLGPRALRAYLRQSNLHEFLAADGPQPRITLPTDVNRLIVSLP